MKYSIFIKSHPGDFPWLTYCLRSIEKFASGFDEIVIAIPEESDLPLTRERVVKVSERGDGYVFQQVVKMNSDLYCKGDFILHLDSDTILTREITPRDFMFHGQPVWLMTPMAEILSGDPNTHAWNRAMTRFMGDAPAFEFMRRIGQMIPRWAYGCFRDFCQRQHGMTFEEWAFAQPHREVTEFNLMGYFLHTNFPNSVHFHDTRYGIFEPAVRQFWSHGGLTEELKTEIEAALS